VAKRGAVYIRIPGQARSTLLRGLGERRPRHVKRGDVDTAIDSQSQRIIDRSAPSSAAPEEEERVGGESSIGNAWESGLLFHVIPVEGSGGNGGDPAAAAAGCWQAHAGRDDAELKVVGESDVGRKERDQSNVPHMISRTPRQRRKPIHLFITFPRYVLFGDFYVG
jgi:hypothetical protein